MKLTLKKPITLGEQGAPIESLTFRDEICAGDLRNIKTKSLQDPTFDDLLKIAAHLCAQPDLVISKLGLDDMAEVINLVSGFMSAGPETGTKSSP
jgi:hypothetical protein